MPTEVIILRFINEDLLDDQPGATVDAETELLIDGVLDSLGVMRLIAYLESECGIAVPPEDVTIDKFRTVTVLADYLRGRTGGATTSAADGGG